MRSAGSGSSLQAAVGLAAAAGTILAPMLFALAVGGAVSAVMLAAVPPAFAIDPGRATGTLRVGNETIVLTHAYAHFHDNAEGILSRATELRIVVADGEMDQAELAGMVFLPVEERAKKGEIKGLLIALDPANPNAVNVTYLYPSEEGYSLMNQTLSTTGKDLWKRFAFDPQRVGGAVEEGDVNAEDDPDAMFPTRAFTLEFSAPVFNEPAVTADLKGKSAKESPQAKILRERTAMMMTGDIAGIEKLSTARSNAKMKEYMTASGMSREDAAAMMKQFGPEQKTMLDKIDRVVERGDRAVLVFKIDDGKQWATFALEDGVWKSDD